MAKPENRAKGQRKTKDPCPACFLHKSLCICAERPSLDLKTRVVLVVHAKELKRTTNTGRLAVQALVNSEMKIRGQVGQPLDLTSVLDPKYRSFLFFPSADAVDLGPSLIAQSAQPIQLIVPDGNWRQASKVQSRHPEIAHLPRVKIAQANLSTQHLRAESSVEGMATLQAIGEALRRIEGEEVFAQLDRFYRAKLNGTLRGRGLSPG